MKKLITLSLLFLSQIAVAKPIVVAVVDTGINDEVIASGRSKGFCKMGHRDFTGEGLTDYHGHGSNVAGLIVKNAQDADFCIVILKVYQFNKDKCLQNKVEQYKQNPPPFMKDIIRQVKSELIDNIIKAKVQSQCEPNHLKWMEEAIDYAINIKVDILNISGGGVTQASKEKQLILKALDKGIKVVAAAGNEHSDLSKLPFYPALYDNRIIVVGNGKSPNNRAPSSNYGSQVTVWEDGTNKEAYGITQTGTSQSTAIYTGKLVRKIHVQGRR